jgi:hypothetical protein
MDWAKGRQGKKEVDSTICLKEPIADLKSSPKDPVLMLHLLEHKLTNYNNICLWKLHPITLKIIKERTHHIPVFWLGPLKTPQPLPSLDS